MNRMVVGFVLLLAGCALVGCKYDKGRTFLKGVDCWRNGYA